MNYSSKRLMDVRYCLGLVYYYEFPIDSIQMGFFWANQNVPVYAFLSGFAVTGIAGWVIMQCNFKKIMMSGDRIHTISSKQILSLSTPMLMTAMMNFLIGQTGVLILGMYRSGAEVGYYAIAVKLATLTTFILTAITSMAAPKFSELYFTGKMDELFYIAKKSTKLIFWLTTPLLLILLLLGNVVLSVVFGKEFSVAYIPMVFLIVGQFVNAISGSTGMFMTMTGREKQYRNIMLLAAFMNIVINLIFTPKFGSIGAAIAGMFSLVFWNIITLVYIKIIHGKTIGYFPMPEFWIKRVISKG